MITKIIILTTIIIIIKNSNSNSNNNINSNNKKNNDNGHKNNNCNKKSNNSNSENNNSIKANENRCRKSILKRTYVQILTMPTKKFKKTYHPTLPLQVQRSKGSKDRHLHTLSSMLRPKGAIVFRVLFQ